MLAKQIIGKSDVLKDLRRKIAECEKQLSQETDPQRLTQLQIDLEKYRGWLTSLRTGLWTS
jgi:hypothetical protein